MKMFDINNGIKSIYWMTGVVVVAFLVLLAVLLSRVVGVGSLADLPVEAYVEAPRNFSGNRYHYDGRIERQLGYHEEVGRILLTSSIAGQSPIPLFISVNLEDFSPNPGQIFRFSVRVDGDGMLNVKQFGKL